MRKKPDGLAWFTKPEIALKQRVKDHYRNEKEQEQRELLEHVEVIKEKQAALVGYLLDQMSSCLDVLDIDRVHQSAEQGHTPKPPLDIIIEPDQILKSKTVNQLSAKTRLRKGKANLTAPNKGLFTGKQ